MSMCNDVAQVEDRSRRTFLADFGLARAITSSQALGTKTMQSGTPGFQAPEQLRNEGVDEKADVYAMGAVLIELFGEKPLWPPLSWYQIMYRVSVEGQFPTCAHLPQPLQKVCGMCLTNKASRAPSAMVLKSLCELARKHLWPQSRFVASMVHNTIVCMPVFMYCVCWQPHCMGQWTMIIITIM